MKINEALSGELTQPSLGVPSDAALYGFEDTWRRSQEKEPGEGCKVHGKDTSIPRAAPVNGEPSAHTEDKHSPTEDREDLETG